jgi:hypothetical protein
MMNLQDLNSSPNQDKATHDTPRYLEITTSIFTEQENAQQLVNA